MDEARVIETAITLLLFAQQVVLKRPPASAQAPGLAVLRPTVVLGQGVPARVLGTVRARWRPARVLQQRGK